jgi:hypothetical protein
LQAELHSRGLTRAVVAYSDLLTDWQGVLQRVDAVLDLRLPLGAAAFHAKGNDFISPEFNRSQLDADEFQSCGTLAEMASALYPVLLTPIADEVDVLRQRFMAYQRDIQPWGGVLKHVQAFEERFFNVDLGKRFSFSRLQSKLNWAGALADDFDSANSVVSKWVYGAGRQSVRLAFSHPCVAEKCRLTFVNRPTYIRVHSLVMQQEETVLGGWEHLHESLIGHSNSAFDLTDRASDSIDAWLFLDSKGYLDIKLPGNQRLALDQRCCLLLDIEISDISAALRPLLFKLGQLQKEVGKLRKQLNGQDTKPARVKPVVALAADLADLNGLLQRALEVRDQRIVSQQHMLDRMRNELLRAEAQLDLLKDVMIGQLDDDRF